MEMKSDTKATLSFVSVLWLIFSVPVSATAQEDRTVEQFGDRIMGICDASAAAVTLDDRLVIATDEHNKLIAFSRAGSRLGDLAPTLEQLLRESGLELEIDDDTEAPRELDIEGVAVIPGGERMLAFWIGSHARRKAKWNEDDQKVRSPKLRPNRRVLFATNLPGPGASLQLEGRPCQSLAKALLSPPLELKAKLAILKESEPRWPNAGGWNIEGLTADPEGRLIVGFRSPVDGQGRALVVRVENPMEVLGGEGVELGAAEWLDLGSRGIRSVDWAPSLERYLVVAGPVDHVDVSQATLPQHSDLASDFAVYEWEGFDSAPVRLKVDLSDLRPEILVPVEGGFHLISDDGKETRGDKTCAEHLSATGHDHPGVYARSRFFPLSR